MRHQNLLRSFSLTLIVLLLSACTASLTPSASTPLADTPTSASSVDTPTAAPSVDTPTSVPPTVQLYEIMQDLPYQTDGSDYAQARGTLDIYLPKDNENFPVLVWFHGGALVSGNKSEFYATSVAKRFASEGIGVVLPNYRLAPQAKYPAYIEDAASAVAWVYDNIATYQGNPEQLFVGGHSSGAYLAAMIGMDEQYLKQHQLSLQQIAGVIPLSGEMFGDTTVWREQGIGKKDVDETKIDETTPMFYVRRDVPPFLNMCAERAESPPQTCEENQKFIEALQATGHPNVTFQVIPDRTHLTVSEMRSPDNPAVTHMLTFIEEAGSGD